LHEGYREMQTSYAAATAGRLPHPAPCEVYCHTLTDSSILSPELRQQGYQTLTLFGLDMPYRLFAENSAVTGKEIWEAYRQSLEGICAESFTDCLALDRHGEPCVEVKTARDLDLELDLPTGNIFHNAPSWFFAESENQVGQRGVETEFANLWLAGSAAQRGGAVSGIPGYHAAQAILDRDRKKKNGAV
jgi:phytoene dehydrogenase-like protein